MRISREQVEANRTRILDAAGRLFRQRGIEAVSIVEVMRNAGLTHGGFYNHFDSKDSLVRAALASPPETNPGAGDVRRAADAYLSRAHRDEPAGGCPLPSLGPELSRASADVRQTATETVRASFEEFSAGALGRTAAERRRKAILARAAMVGAVVLARIVDDPALADEILAATRAELPLAS
jgi:TetR/AcrR family transcriptional regulator, transcriptional repressor for nem operon